MAGVSILLSQLSAAPLPPAQGGTGVTTAAAEQVRIGAVDPALALIAQQGQAALVQAQLNLGVLTPGQALALAIAN